MHFTEKSVAPAEPRPSSASLDFLSAVKPQFRVPEYGEQILFRPAPRPRPHERQSLSRCGRAQGGRPPVPICQPVVEYESVECALAPKDFQTFASPKALGGHNIQVVGFGPLEHGPHNLVHNCVGGGYNGNGGFMLNFMSPVDPIFFLHHSNIDRLWEIWTRKQAAAGYPALPEGKDLEAWSNEPFLFFVDEKGRPLSATAGD